MNPGSYSEILLHNTNHMWNLIADYAPDALALLGGLIVVVCTLRDFSLEESKPTTRSTRRRLAVAIALGGVMSIVGAFLSSQQNGHFQKELAGKANELKLKSDEIAGLNRKIADYLSGGNSFCYVTADNENTTESKELSFYYRQSGDTPTWDVKLLVTDAYAYGRLMPKFPAHSLIPLSEMTDKQLSQLREAANTKFVVQVGNLSPSENGVAFKTAATPEKKMVRNTNSHKKRVLCGNPTDPKSERTLGLSIQGLEICIRSEEPE